MKYYYSEKVDNIGCILTTLHVSIFKTGDEQCKTITEENAKEKVELYKMYLAKGHTVTEALDRAQLDMDAKIAGLMVYKPVQCVDKIIVTCELKE